MVSLARDSSSTFFHTGSKCATRRNNTEEKSRHSPSTAPPLDGLPRFSLPSPSTLPSLQGVIDSVSAVHVEGGAKEPMSGTNAPPPLPMVSNPSLLRSAKPRSRIQQTLTFIYFTFSLKPRPLSPSVLAGGVTVGVKRAAENERQGKSARVLRFMIR